MSSPKKQKLDHSSTEEHKAIVTINNYIGGVYTPPTTNQYQHLISPATGQVHGQVALSDDKVRTTDYYCQALPDTGRAIPIWC